jgi:hypothetical protein
MSTTDAPTDEEAAAKVPLDRRASNETAAMRVPLDRRASLCKTPLVLQVSPLPGASDPDKFFYNPFANIKSGDFAAACAFFIHNGHTVVYHECPDAIAFQELFPLATIRYISLLPEGLIAKGHHLLNKQRALFRASQRKDPTTAPPPVTPPRSLLDHYVAAGFAGSQGRAPSASATSGDSSYSHGLDYLQSSSSTARRSHNASSTVVVPCIPSWGHARFSSQRPDPDGYLTDQASPIPCYGGNSRSYVGQWANPYGGHPSSRYGGRYERQSQVPCKVPYYIFQQGYPPALPVMGPHAATLVASSIDGSSAPLRSLPHADLHSASASDLTASLAPGPPVSGAPGNPAFSLSHLPIPGQIPPQAYVPQAAPALTAVHVLMMAPTVPAVAPAAPSPAVHILMMAPTVPAVALAAPSPPAAAPPTPALPPLPPAAPTAARVELLKLDPIKDAKAFLDSFKTIQYYL